MNEDGEKDKFTIGYTNINSWYEPMGYLLMDTNRARINAHIDPHKNTIIQYIAALSALSDNLLPYIKEGGIRTKIREYEREALGKVTFVSRQLTAGEDLLKKLNAWYYELMEGAAKAQIFLKIKYIPREKSDLEKFRGSFR